MQLIGKLAIKWIAIAPTTMTASCGRMKRALCATIAMLANKAF